jgi:hypothetical protein
MCSERSAVRIASRSSRFARRRHYSRSPVASIHRTKLVCMCRSSSSSNPIHHTTSNRSSVRSRTTERRTHRCCNRRTNRMSCSYCTVHSWRTSNMMGNSSSSSNPRSPRNRSLHSRSSRRTPERTKRRTPTARPTSACVRDPANSPGTNPSNSCCTKVRSSCCRRRHNSRRSSSCMASNSSCTECSPRNTSRRPRRSIAHSLARQCLRTTTARPRSRGDVLNSLSY